MPVSCWIYVVLGEIPSLSILQQLLLHNTFGRVLGIDGGTKINISLGGQPTLMEELKHKRKQKCSDGCCLAVATKISWDLLVSNDWGSKSNKCKRLFVCFNF